MAEAHVTVEVGINGENVASIEVPVSLTAGELADGLVPVGIDTDDFSSRITRGLQAFQRAVR